MSYIMCSGGKDSMATCIVAKEYNVHIDGVIISEVMFDIRRNISGEHPLHVSFLYNKAIPFIENVLGFPVFVVRSHKDYLSVFHSVIGERGAIDRRGKKLGFPLASGCVMRRVLKVKPINDFMRVLGNVEQIVGIASDELFRLDRMHNRGQVSLLERYNITELKCVDICKNYNMYSDYYSLGFKRQGCWFCPNASIHQFSKFAKDYPSLWNELRLLSKDPNLVSYNFRYGKSFSYVDSLVQLYCNQISFSDFGLL